MLFHFLKKSYAIVVSRLRGGHPACLCLCSTAPAANECLSHINDTESLLWEKVKKGEEINQKTWMRGGCYSILWNSTVHSTLQLASIFCRCWELHTIHVFPFWYSLSSYIHKWSKNLQIQLSSLQLTQPLCMDPEKVENLPGIEALQQC